jgi:hypothetical protein
MIRIGVREDSYLARGTSHGCATYVNGILVNSSEMILNHHHISAHLPLTRASGPLAPYPRSSLIPAHAPNEWLIVSRFPRGGSAQQLPQRTHSASDGRWVKVRRAPNCTPPLPCEPGRSLMVSLEPAGGYEGANVGGMGGRDRAHRCFHKSPAADRVGSGSCDSAAAFHGAGPTVVAFARTCSGGYSGLGRTSILAASGWSDLLSWALLGRALNSTRTPPSLSYSTAGDSRFVASVSRRLSCLRSGKAKRKS